MAAFPLYFESKLDYNDSKRQEKAFFWINMLLDSNNLIQKALLTATNTREIHVGRHILSKISDIFKRNFPGSKTVLIADETTWDAAGFTVRNHLLEADIEIGETLVFPAIPKPVADYDHLRAVRDVLAKAGPNARAIAIGAGTINDLCKRASEERHQPYICVATAASVDGYASFGAPITKDGFKSTWPCAAPRVIIADSDILLTAPRELTASGYADLAAKVASGADWYLADAMGLDPIQPKVWATTQIPLRDWLANPAALSNGEPTAILNLFTGLAMTGFAMQTTHSSRPASGAEHLFSHVWEMWDVVKPNGEHPSHGEKVGIGTLCTTNMLFSFFEKPFVDSDIERAVAAYPSWNKIEKRIRNLLGKGAIGDQAVSASRAKYPTPGILRERLGRLVDVWDELSGKVRKQLIPYAELKAMFQAARCPVTPEGIGVRRADVPSCALAAQLIRNRYTILDLALDTGRLDRLANELTSIW